MPISRRALLQILSGSTFILTAAPTAFAARITGQKRDAARFPQGVASADPQPDAVMLWTRAEPVDPHADNVRITVELGESAEFDSILLSQDVVAAADSDFTVRAFVRGLEPGKTYYYRFRGDETSVSRTGRTRTAPASDDPREVRVAFASCQSYEQGYYGSWARMLADDEAAPADKKIDFVLHLGDFIYERCWHKRIDGRPQTRTVPPFPDGVNTEDNRYAVSLADYRHLYRVYLSDPHLQAARARWPFVCTWDDHEYSNDNFQSYSTYDGNILLDPERKMRANQAWFEFIPAVLGDIEGSPAHDFRATGLDGDDDARNRQAVDSLCIYRSFRWGSHVDVVLTDTRSYRSGPSLPDELAGELGLPLNTVTLVEIGDGGKTYNANNPPDTLPYGDGTTKNPAKDRAPGTLLGERQRDWFVETLSNSTARWKLWGNALPFTPMRVDLSSLPFAGYEDSVVNIDAWSGFPYEQRNLLGALQSAGVSGLISLSGDHHMHGAAAVAASISDPESDPVLVDFSVAGISSSPVFADLVAAASGSQSSFQDLVFSAAGDSLTPVWNMTMLYGVLAAFLYANTGFATPARWLGPNSANRGLGFIDVTANGYGLAVFGADEVTTELVAITDSESAFEQAPAVRYRARFRVSHWEAGAAPSLETPEFEGTAPFPFGHNSV